MTSSNLERKIEQAEQNLQRKLDWNSRFDGRIAFAWAISLAMLGILSSATTSVELWTWYLYVIFGVTGLLLFISIILIYYSQYPKTRSPNASLLYFGTISKLTFAEYKKQFKEASEEEYLDDLLCQTHTNAGILNKKFSKLKAAFILIMISVMPWLIAIYLSKLYLK